MRAASICLLSLLTLGTSATEDEQLSQECGQICLPYFQAGHNCQLHNGCFQKQGDERLACETHCMATYDTCRSLCAQSHDQLQMTCAEKCTSSSGESCEDDCIMQELRTQHPDQLPDITQPQVGIWQGVPVLDSDESANEEPADRRDASRSWEDSSSSLEHDSHFDDDEDRFGDWW